MIFITNRYYHLYYRIIEKAKNRILPLESYREKHHIIPKSLGGTDDKSNLVELTYKEHRLCHKLLIKFTTGKNKYKMAYALLFFKVDEKTKINLTQYLSMYRKQFNIITDGVIDKWWLKGEKLPEGFKMGFSQVTIKKHGDGNKGKKWVTNGLLSKQPKNGELPEGWYYGQAEYQKKINSLALRGKNNPMYGKIWINNTNINRIIDKNQSIPEGWNLGKVEKYSKIKSQSKKGVSNPMYGKVPKNAIKVIVNNIEYTSMKEAMKKTGMSRRSIEKIVKSNRQIGGETL